MLRLEHNYENIRIYFSFFFRSIACIYVQLSPARHSMRHGIYLWLIWQHWTCLPDDLRPADVIIVTFDAPFRCFYFRVFNALSALEVLCDYVLTLMLTTYVLLEYSCWAVDCLLCLLLVSHWRCLLLRLCFCVTDRVSKAGCVCVAGQWWVPDLWERLSRCQRPHLRPDRPRHDGGRMS